MTLADLRRSLTSPSLPPDLSLPLQALWHEAKGNWEKAHHLVQDESGSASAWVHAHLHRKEGDLSNAQYWYERAGKDTSNLDPHQEWEETAQILLTISWSSPLIFCTIHFSFLRNGHFSF